MTFFKLISLILYFSALSWGDAKKAVGGKKTLFNSRSQELKDCWDNQQSLNLTLAIKDIVRGLPATQIALIFGTSYVDGPVGDASFPATLIKTLHEDGITTSINVIDTEKPEEKFFKSTKEAMIRFAYAINLIFVSQNDARNLLCAIQEQDLIHRKFLNIIYWGNQPIDLTFAGDFSEAMRVAVISNPRPGTYRVYYSQADPSGDNSLLLVNWWSLETGLFKNPVLPKPNDVYADFHRRVFVIPVLHKPPWHFVIYKNDSTMEVEGGRDDKLLRVLADKLNFRYEYVDPPERNQGSSFNKNGTFPGVLGLIWKREADFFMGDVTINLERSAAVEFSFLTLVDSEVFVTHRPSKLNEALALVRPFQWQVWPFVVTLIIVSGPTLFLILETPSIWRGGQRDSNKSRRRLLSDCVWFTTALFLRQGGKQPGKSHKVRLVLILMTLGSTYVIGDMYSANLTSLLARPGREKPITTLEQLEIAMDKRGYQLFVEKHSSSYSTLQNGTGIYERIWTKMLHQPHSIIESIEAGMKLVRAKMNVAVLGGRETVFFDTKRFGSFNFHLSEKLNTRYSAIAMQTGCPYIENFNKILMQLFEGGILTKMTEEEYELLGEKLRAAAGIGQTDEDIAAARKETAKSGEASDLVGVEENVQEGDSKQPPGGENEHQLQPLNTSMLQGAFYILLIGYLISGVALIVEKTQPNFSLKISRRNKSVKLKGFRKTRCVKLKRKIKSLQEVVDKALKDMIEENAVTTNKQLIEPENTSPQLPYVE